MKSTTIHPRRLFAIDSIGALVSTFMLGLVLVRYEDIIGMPPDILYLLAIIAGVLCLFSFGCYLFVIRNETLFLKIIAFANTGYACLTLGLIICLRNSLTTLGFLYFILELFVLFILIVMELRSANRVL